MVPTANMSVIGISASDIFLITQFTVNLIAALKEEGGSKSKYQQEIHSLESLGSILAEINDLSATASPSPFHDKLRAQTDHATSLIESCRNSIAKYGKALGPDAPKGRLHGGFRKAQWLLSATKDLQAFREAIASELDAIRFLLSKQVL